MLLIARYAERKDEDGISRVKKQRVKKKQKKVVMDKKQMAKEGEEERMMRNEWKK